MYYSVKLRWMEPKEGTDQMKKIAKQYLVYALSVTEAELRVNEWVPSNFQDAVVEEVKQTQISEIRIEGEAETFWQVKFIDDADGREKPKPYFTLVNALNIEEAVKKVNKGFSFTEMEEVKKFKGVVDEDLISEEIKK